MAKLVFLSGPYQGKSFTLSPGKTITLGRNRELELPLPDLKLSRRHCMIASTGDDKFFINDLESTNGTFINGMRLTGGQELNPFDRVLIGDTEIEFQSDPSGKLTAIKGDGMAAIVDEPAPAPMAPPSRADTLNDMLNEAIRELAMPLPPEPPPLDGAPAAAANATPKVLFCDGCSGSIPMLDWDLGVAKEINNRIYCKDCLSRGVQTSPAPDQGDAASAAFSSGSSSRETARVLPNKPKPAAPSVDDILAGLDMEPVVIDTTPKRHRKESDVALKAAPIAPPPAATPIPTKHPTPSEEPLLGDDFEEIR